MQLPNDHPACQEIVRLFGDLEECLKGITPDWRERRLSADKLLAAHWKRFSAYPDVDAARKLRNRIHHREVPSPKESDVRNAATCLGLALREILTVPGIPEDLRKKFAILLLPSAKPYRGRTRDDALALLGRHFDAADDQLSTAAHGADDYDWLELILLREYLLECQFSDPVTNDEADWLWFFTVRPPGFSGLIPAFLAGHPFGPMDQAPTPRERRRQDYSRTTASVLVVSGDCLERDISKHGGSVINVLVDRIMAASPLLDRELRDDRPFITGVLNRALSRNVKLPASSISTDSPNVSGRLQKGETRFREERLEGHKESAQPGNEPSGVFSRRIQENFRKIFGTMAHKCASPEDPFAEEVLDECTSSNSKLDGSCNQPSLKTELSDLFERKPSSDFAYEIFACPSNCRGTVLIPTGAILATTGTCATCKSEWILTKQSPLTISLYSWRPKIGFTPGRYVREAIGLEITVGTVSRFLSTEVFLGLQVDDELLRHSEKRATILHDYVVEFLYDYPVHLRPSTFYVLKAGIEKVLFADQPGGSIMVRMIRECLK